LSQRQNVETSEDDMSLINDYSVSLLAAQRQRELQDEAREARVARLAAGSRPSWWQRLSGSRGRQSGTAAPRPVPVPQHRAAH
jgi:hypothetical protein